MSYTNVYIKGVVFEVKYEYTPEDPMVYNYGDGSGYPGRESDVTIEDVLLDNVSVVDMLSEDTIEAISEKIHKTEKENEQV